MGLCCFGNSSSPRKRGRKERGRSAAAEATSTGAVPKSPPNRSYLAPLNDHHDDDWQDARTDFSSETASPRNSLSLEHHDDLNHHNQAAGGEGVPSVDGTEGSSPRNGMVGCFTALTDKLPSLEFLERTASQNPHTAGAHADAKDLKSPESRKPRAGESFPRRDFSAPEHECRMCWDEGDSSTVRLRSVDYIRSRVKESGGKPFYHLVAVDLFTTDTKVRHVARLVDLPKRPATHDPVIPPLLVVNLQLPIYTASLFGSTTDGPGHHFVYYYALPEGFDGSKCANQAAVGLLRRLVQDGTEADGAPTRERLKFIPRVMNIDEWAEKGPLNAAETRLLVNYNEKPILTRPQHAFYSGEGYLEIDIDVHEYSFLARRPIFSYMNRLADVVWETALVVQGNAPDELPEQLLGCARVYRTDFLKPRAKADWLVAAAAAAPS